uniref:Transmembrane protein 81 n=1 Tax=Echeneis naucrates TaxID=173247 RepID=A0A665VNX4_ECHNA
MKCRMDESAGPRLPHLLFLLLLLFRPLTSADPEETDKVAVEVIVDSSPCSTTCGLGIKTQTVCLMEDGKVSEECHVRRVKCLQSWKCGLMTMTVYSGQRVEIDCLGEVMEAMGRVLWRYARGIISSDDSLFGPWEAPQLDRVILDPVREADAGTYCCDVQDAFFRRVKRVYWGIRVLPADVLNLDYESSLARWDSNRNHQNQTVSNQHHHETTLRYTVQFEAYRTMVVFLEKN